MSMPPVIRAGLQSGSIMCIADAFTQRVVEGRPEVNVNRSTQWALAGLLIHGPYFYLGFRQVDCHFGAATSFKIVVQKTAVAQFVLFPPYLVALFTYLGWWEKSPSIRAKVRHCVPQAFYGGCIFWPVANGINFAFVPSSLRVPYLALSAGVWNSYLSWTNAKDKAQLDVKEVE